MNRFLIPSLALLVAALSFPCAAAAQPKDAPTVKRIGPGQASSTRTVTLTAKVKAVDVEKRMLTLEAKDGRSETFVVDPAVKRLAEIAPGDTIVLKYQQALLLQFQPADEKAAEPSVTAAVERAGADKAPGGAAVAQVRGTVKVSAVDQKSRVVVLETPKGELLKVKADKSIDLSKVKAGQKYFGVYSEQVAVSVEKAGAQKAPAKEPAKAPAAK